MEIAIEKVDQISGHLPLGFYKTGNGRVVEIYKYDDGKDGKDPYPLLGRVGDDEEAWTATGSYYSYRTDIMDLGCKVQTDPAPKDTEFVTWPRSLEQARDGAVVAVSHGYNRLMDAGLTLLDIARDAVRNRAQAVRRYSAPHHHG